jgi:hypothetical protein
MDRMLPPRSSSVFLAALLALGLASTAGAQGPGGGPVNLRVVDQNGVELTGSKVSLVGTDQSWVTPTTADLGFGPQLVTVEPAFQGAMFEGGWMRPGAPNGLVRDEFVFVDGSPELVIVWNTAQVAVDVVDPAQAPIVGASWGFEGDGNWFAPGTVTAPITDESVYSSMSGASRDGWRFAVRAAFDGQAIDLTRAEAREVDGATTGLAFEWRQSACNMGVVDGAGVPIRGATWTMFGHTFAAGDAITLPTTDESLYPSLGGAFASGIPTSLFTNTPAGSGNATFEVNADGSLAPAFVTIGGGSFGLRCGVAPFPPITTGALDGTVLADGKLKPGVGVTLVDANGLSRGATTDAVGGFLFTDVPQGAASVTLTVPAGFHPLKPLSGVIATTITAGATTTVGFEIESDVAPPPPAVNVPETANYWRKEIRAAQRGRGNHAESFADMSTNYPQAIFDQFANDADPVRVQGVTQVDPDGAGPLPARRLTINDMDATIDPTIATANAAAKKQLLVILLNVVSHRLSLDLVVDAQGTTLAQQIREIAAMINDGKAANDRKAHNLAARINAGRATETRLLPRLNDAPLAVEMAPAGLVATRDGGTRIRFTMSLPRAGAVKLDLYDVSGRHVARLYEGDAPAGDTGVTWSRNGARPGVYFARMLAEDGAHVAKIVATN